ncbi:MAG: hypothetical protein AB7D00_01090 [Rhodospirillaceae bacterium]
MKITILSVLVRYAVMAALDMGGMLAVLAAWSFCMGLAISYAIAAQRPDILIWMRDHTFALVLCGVIVTLVNVATWYAAWSRRVSRAAADHLLNRGEV